MSRYLSFSHRAALSRTTPCISPIYKTFSERWIGKDVERYGSGIVWGTVYAFCGHAVVGWLTELQAERSRVRFPMVSLQNFIDIILPAALWSWSRLSLQQKWVPGIFLVGKGGRCVGLTTLQHLCADCLEIWEPQIPGALRTCPGLWRNSFSFISSFHCRNWTKPRSISVRLATLKSEIKNPQIRGRSANRRSANHRSANHRSANNRSANHGSANHGSANSGSANHGSTNHRSTNHRSANHRSVNNRSANNRSATHRSANHTTLTSSQTHTNYVSIYLSIYPSIYLSIYLSISVVPQAKES